MSENSDDTTMKQALNNTLENIHELSATQEMAFGIILTGHNSPEGKVVDLNAFVAGDEPHLCRAMHLLVDVILHERGPEIVKPLLVPLIARLFFGPAPLGKEQDSKEAEDTAGFDLSEFDEETQNKVISLLDRFKKPTSGGMH